MTAKCDTSLSLPLPREHQNSKPLSKPEIRRLNIGGKKPPATLPKPPLDTLPKPANRPVRESSAGPTKTSPPVQTVRFELTAPGVRAVFLAGSFNAWSPTAMPTNRQGEVKWVKELLLTPGRYEYQFVVDGRWTPDLTAKDGMPNPFGGFNSVVDVRPPA